MLVITRKDGQSLTLGSDIVVTILSSRQNRVSLGIEAPESVAIWRTEMLEQHDGIDEESRRRAEYVGPHLPQGR